jgi:hypothetical protein
MRRGEIYLRIDALHARSSARRVRIGIRSSIQVVVGGAQLTSRTAQTARHYGHNVTAGAVLIADMQMPAPEVPNQRHNPGNCEEREQGIVGRSTTKYSQLRKVSSAADGSARGGIVFTYCICRNILTTIKFLH